VSLGCVVVVFVLMGGEYGVLTCICVNRKKAEQAEAREAIKAEKGQATRVGGALGQTGGPANPVDNEGQGGGNYPNSSY